MAELNITALNFETEVLHSDKPVLLDFYANWCGPCKMLSPVLHEIAEEYADALKVGKVNVDEQMELAMRFQVSSIPMVVLFKNGKAVARRVTPIGATAKVPAAQSCRGTVYPVGVVPCPLRRHGIKNKESRFYLLSLFSGG